MKKNRNVTKTFLIFSLFVLMISGCTKEAKSEHSYPKKTLKIGVDEYFSPYTFRDGNGNFVGFDVDIATIAADYLYAKPVFIPIRWAEDNRQKLLENGTVDCVWSCCAINDNELFTIPYIKTEKSFVVCATSKIKSSADIKNAKIGVQSGSKALDDVLALKDENPSLFSVIYEFPSHRDLFGYLKLGNIDVIADDYNALNFKAEKSSDYRILQEAIDISFIGVLVKDGNYVLKELLDQAILEMTENGTIKTIAQKWNIKIYN